MMPYSKIVFSKHAHERLEQRKITQEMVLATIQKPDRSYPERDGDTKFIRKINGAKVHVVCKPLPEENKWLVKSAWIRGEYDSQNLAQRKNSYTASELRWVRIYFYLMLALFALFAVWYFSSASNF